MQWVWDLLTLNFNNSSTVTVTKTGNGYTWHAAPSSKVSVPPIYYPFKVYKATSAQIKAGLGDDADPEDAIRTFVVRCGRVGNDPITGDGQDGYNTDPDSTFLPTVLPDTTPVIPQVVPPDLDAYYFWIEMTADGPELHSDDDPTSDGWDTWPEPDGLHIMIAEVNTINDKPIIRQLLRADFPITVKLEVRTQ